LQETVAEVDKGKKSTCLLWNPATTKDYKLPPFKISVNDLLHLLPSHLAAFRSHQQNSTTDRRKRVAGFTSLLISPQRYDVTPVHGTRT
jgi:hypothetical protein